MSLFTAPLDGTVPAPSNVAIVGKMCTGKSTLSDCLRERADRCEFARLSFATRIKQLAVELFDMPPGTKDRDLLCYIGRVMRERDRTVWIRALLKMVKNYNEAGVSVVVDDCRFKAELVALRAAGFRVVQCKCSEATQLERLKAVYPRDWPAHVLKRDSPSECDLDGEDGFDYVADESQSAEAHAEAVCALFNI